MGHGNYQKKTKRIPILARVLILMALLGTVTGGVVAYLSYATPVIRNTFQVDEELDPAVTETMEENVKSDVAVTVNKDLDHAVYVRAAIVATWRRAGAETETVLPQNPVAGTDYEISLNLADWFEEGGFYYHKAAVNPGMKTADLIEACQPMVTRDGYVLNVEIMAQTVQALGTTDDGDTPAVTDAWGVQVENGQLKPTSPTP